MKFLIIVSASALALTSPSLAANEAGMKPAKSSQNTPSKMMSRNDCSALWKKASPDGAALKTDAASAYLSDAGKANADGDDTIEKSEFMNACTNGGAKTADASDNINPNTPTSDRTPQKETTTPLPQVKSVGGETSDRTPSN